MVGGVFFGLLGTFGMRERRWWLCDLGGNSPLIKIIGKLENKERENSKEFTCVVGSSRWFPALSVYG